MEPIQVAANRVGVTTGEDGEEGDNQWKPVPVPLSDENGEVVRTLTCYPPEEGQLAVFMATTSKHAGMQEQIAGVLNFFVSLLDEPDHVYVVNRMLDRKDPFGAIHIQKIVAALVTEWSGRPTGSPSGSARSQKPGGRKSTRPTPALT